MCPARISPGGAWPLPLFPTRQGPAGSTAGRRRSTEPPARAASAPRPRVSRWRAAPWARQRADGSPGASSINYLLDRSVSADMTTATAPQLAGDAYAAVQHRGSHMQIITSAGSGKTEVVAQPAVPAPAEQDPAPAQSGALKFGQTHVYENGVEMTVERAHRVHARQVRRRWRGRRALREGHRDDQERVGAAVRPDHGPPDRVERRAGRRPGLRRQGRWQPRPHRPGAGVVCSPNYHADQFR